MPALGTGQAWVEEGLSLTHPDPAVRAAALHRLEGHLELAAEWGAMVIIGLIRGRLGPGEDPEEARARLAEGLDRLARQAAARGVRLALEPLNRYEADLLHTVEEALALIQELGHEGIGILFDTFHANIEEASMEAALRQAGPCLFHVHLADSNRRAPGWGHLDFRPLLTTLRAIGYRGWLSAEVLPVPSLEAAMTQFAQWARSTLDLLTGLAG